MKLSIQPILIFLLFFASCSTTEQLQETASEVDILRHPTTQATLWVQNSAEYKALTMQVYETAKRNLLLPLQDSFWTASVAQQGSDFSSRPPAIILDIDETVLDNSPFQARMIKQNESFSIEEWNKWCNEGIANAIPGAVEFTNYAAEQGVTIFYISNRDHEVEEATRQNMINEGFPVADHMDNILTAGERPEWTSSKIERRKMVEDNYRVIMIIGDDLNDFLPAKNISQQERVDIIDNHAKYFGRKWFMLPNPVYGSWDQALYNFENDITEERRKEIQLQQLDSKEQD